MALHTSLIVFALVLCALPNALGIVCNVCAPNQTAMTFCNQPSEFREVNCSNEIKPQAVPLGMEFNACATTTIGAKFNDLPVVTYAMNCAIRVNSSDPAKVNCSLTESYICADARARAQNSSGAITITSCSSQCCTTPKCNVKDLGVSSTSAPVTTPTVKSGVSSQWPRLAFHLIGLALYITLK